MKKKALIMTTALLVVIALAVGVSFAVWNVNSKAKEFNVSIGKNIDLRVSFAGYNSSVEGENIYTGTEEGKIACDDMILIPNGAVLETNQNNAYNVLFGTFKITGNGGWDADTLKAVYNLKSLMLDDLDLSATENAKYNVFDVKIYNADNVAVNTDYVSKSIPNADAVEISNTEALTLDGTYYVFVSFKSDFNGSASDFIGKSIKINIEINASAINA